MKFLVVNGPNLNLLGVREKNIYGESTYEELCKAVEARAKELKAEADFYQSNHEGDIVTAMQNAKGGYGGIIINAGALTHYSYALYDALKYTELPAVEVHVSNIFKREDFRKQSVLSPACVGIISGLGVHGYIYALEYLYNTTNYKRR